MVGMLFARQYMLFARQYMLIASIAATHYRVCNVHIVFIKNSGLPLCSRAHNLKCSHIGAAGMRSELTFKRGGTVVIARVKSGEANVFAKGRSPSALPSFIGKPIPMVPPCPFVDK